MALTVERLKEILHYDRETGVFVWLIKPRQRTPAGAIAGSVDKDGYIQIRIAGVSYRAHRLAWFYVHGAWPANDIDHINGVRTCNSIANLRDVTRQVNLQNMRSARPSSSTSRFLGVSWSEQKKKWAAQISINNRTTSLGSFDDEHEAHTAYVEAKRRLHAGCTI